MAERAGKRLTIVGGGVMGLMTAYHAAPLAGAATVLEKSRAGDRATASFSLTRIGSVEEFVDECMPALRGTEVADVAEASGADICFCDPVADDDFILGPVPGVADVFTGVGWRGTGYKFAPWAGRVLARLALQGTVYDIRRFAPGRFAGGERKDVAGIGGAAG